VDRPIDPATRHRHLLLRLLTVTAVVAVTGLVLVWLAELIRPTLKRSRTRTAQVEQGPIEAVITASGTVIPAHETVLSSPLEARIIKVLRQPGAVLEVGDPILELDVSGARTELEKLTEQLLEAGNRQDEVRLTLEQTLIELRGRLEMKRLDVEEASYSLEQNQELFRLGLIAEPVFRQAEVRLKKSKIELRQTEERVSNAEATSRNQLARIETEIRMLAAEKQELDHRLQLADTRASATGVLTWVADEEGSVVVRGEVLARIADLDSYRVEATVSDVHSARLQPGLPVRIPLASTTLTGQVESVFPTIENGIIRLLVQLDDSSSNLLRSNLRVDVYVVTERKEDVLKIKKGPAFSGPGRQDAFVIEGEVAYRRSVRIGLSGPESYEVVEGLQPGDEVVIGDIQDIAHMNQVKVK
jgi:HlyD family secretion protein